MLLTYLGKKTKKCVRVLKNVLKDNKGIAACGDKPEKEVLPAQRLNLNFFGEKQLGNILF